MTKRTECGKRMHQVLGFLLIGRQYPIDFHLRQITAWQNQLLLKIRYATRAGTLGLLADRPNPSTNNCMFIYRRPFS
jgi:hypothetical protein